MTNQAPQSTGSRREGGSGLSDLTSGNHELAKDVLALRGAVLEHGRTQRQLDEAAREPLTGLNATRLLTDLETIAERMRLARVRVGANFSRLCRTYAPDLVAAVLHDLGLAPALAVQAAADYRAEKIVEQTLKDNRTAARRVQSLEAELYKANQKKRGVA